MTKILNPHINPGNPETVENKKDSDSESELFRKNLNKSHEGEAEVNISSEDHKTTLQELLKLESKTASVAASRRNHDELATEAASTVAKFMKSDNIEAKLAGSEDTHIEEHMYEIRLMKDKRISMETNNMGLDQESEKRAQKVANLNQKFYDTDKGKEDLRSGNIELLSKVLGSEKTLADERDEANLNMKLATDKLSSKVIRLSKNEKLKLELEGADKHGHELTSRLEDAQEENGVLKSEINDLKRYSELLNKQLKDKEAHYRSLASKHREAVEWALDEQKKVEMLSFEVKRVKNKNVQLIDANGKLEDAGKQIAKLTIENPVLIKLELEGIELKELQNALEVFKGNSKNALEVFKGNSKLNENKSQEQVSEETIDDSKDEIEQLRTVNDLLRIKVNDLLQELELAHHKKSELSKQIGIMEEEKSSLISKLERAEVDIRNQKKNLEELSEENSMLQQRNRDMHGRNSDLDSKLGEQASVVLALQKHFAEVRDEATAQIKGMSVRVNNLWSELDLLNTHEGKLEGQMEVTRDRCLEIQNLMKSLDGETTHEFSKQERLLGIVRSSFNDLHKESKQLKYRFQESCQKLEVAEAVSEEQIKVKNKLVGQSSEELQENLNLDEAEKAEMSNEIADLKGQQEAESCLFKQNLDVTVAEYKEKEKKHKNIIEELQRSVKKRKDEFRILFGKLDFSKNELITTIEAVEYGISDCCLELDYLESLFEQKHCQVETQLSAFTSEAEIWKTKMQQGLSEKQERNGVMHDTALRLKNNDESISAIEHEVEGLRAQLSEKEKEMGKVMTKGAESDRRVEQLEKTVAEMEEEIRARNKEKLDLINQLSLMIDYQ